MADIVPPEKRSRMMARIKGTNTKIEMLIRSGLHGLGFRYRIHEKGLPGKPDLTFPKHRAVIFVHGCFWHRHDCHLFKIPSTRTDFWERKFEMNVRNDEKNLTLLRKYGWRVGVVWECALRGKERLPGEVILGLCSKWLESEEPLLEIRGK